ncbi:hypothetical protein [Exiguobacterium sp. s133]|uniref:hypothetical protein n=1 Tax=Exiguobacterium sp. s133 TaxID=2751213 RepID=UPI001BEA8B34|nr:hypothetical protein [Exiguobacterium sp. s133]
MGDLSLGGIFLVVLALFMLSAVCFYIALVIESGKLSLGLEELKERPEKPITRPATWRDGMEVIGMDVGKYEKYAGALTERYPVAMDSLVKMDWLGRKMTEEEKRKVRQGFEEKFEVVIAEEELKRREVMGEEIEDVLKQAFRENEYVK